MCFSTTPNCSVHASVTPTCTCSYLYSALYRCPASTAAGLHLLSLSVAAGRVVFYVVPKRRFTCVTKCSLDSDSALKRGLMRRVEAWLGFTSEWWTRYRTLWTIYEMLYLEWQKPATAVHVESFSSFIWILLIAVSFGPVAGVPGKRHTTKVCWVTASHSALCGFGDKV